MLKNDISYLKFKIHILFEFHRGPWGGGNQFLKALKAQFKERGVYEDDPSKAECILFNSHHNIVELIKLKIKYPNKIIVHRIDGPVYLIRNKDQRVDEMIYMTNSLIADATIFQSKWSKKKNFCLGLKKNRYETVIMNAVDPSIFFIKNNQSDLIQKQKRWNLIATSWSPSKNKGFDLYEYLDQNLDFEQYSMKFIGNSPVNFKNIEHIKPQPPKKLADYLRKSDIFITGSKNDPCSNALIEALACGLPSVVLNDGGHPEIVKKGGETFNTFEECLLKIELIKEDYTKYKRNIQVPDIEEIADQYRDFMRDLYLKSLNNNLTIKKLRIFDYYKLAFYKIKYLVPGIKKKILEVRKLFLPIF